VLGSARDSVGDVTFGVRKRTSKDEHREDAVKTLGDDVQDGEPQVFVINRDDVTSIGETPTDRVDRP